MRHPDDFGKIKRQIADDTCDESAGMQAVCDAIMAEQVWSIGDPVMPVLRLGQGSYTRDIHADELLPSAREKGGANAA